jgi:hypothetical protein
MATQLSLLAGTTPAGTTLAVKTLNSISTKDAVGKQFTAQLDQDIVVKRKGRGSSWNQIDRQGGNLDQDRLFFPDGEPHGELPSMGKPSDQTTGAYRRAQLAAGAAK